MNILFIGPYRQNDEWGRKSRSMLKAIQNTDHSITCRPIYLSRNTTKDLSINHKIEKSEFIIQPQYDILIQFLLQPYAVYDGNVKKRIGIFNTETIPQTIPLGELTKELLMDEIWVENHNIEQNLQTMLNKYNANTQVVTVPPVLDLQHLPLTSPVSIRKANPDLHDRFLFYYIGNVLDKKDGFEESCIAYLNAFTNTDNVALAIATDSPIPQQDIEQAINKCKNALSNKPLYSHPMITIIKTPTGSLTQEERVSLHIDGDCMVCPYYAVSHISNILEGLVYKSTPIVNKDNTLYEWFKEDHLWGADSYEELCNYKLPSPLYRFTCNELWHKPIVTSLMKTMINAYINKFERDKKIEANSKMRQYFTKVSYDHVLTEPLI